MYNSFDRVNHAPLFSKYVKKNKKALSIIKHKKLKNNIWIRRGQRLQRDQQSRAQSDLRKMKKIFFLHQLSLLAKKQLLSLLQHSEMIRNRETDFFQEKITVKFNKLIKKIKILLRDNVITTINILQLMIKLYWNIGSQPARAVKALLLIGNIPHEEIELNLRNNQTRTQQYLKLNPFGQIPFIITADGEGISESSAILQYLCQQYPQKLSKFYGDDLKSRTKVNVFLSWYQSYFRPALFSRIKIKVYGTIKKGIPHTQKQLKESDQFMGEGLKILQNFLKESPYVAGQNPTIADLLIYFQTTNLVYYEMQSNLKELQKVTQWYDKMSSLPEVKDIQTKWRQTVPPFIQFMKSAKPIS